MGKKGVEMVTYHHWHSGGFKAMISVWHRTGCVRIESAHSFRYSWDLMNGALFAHYACVVKLAMTGRSLPPPIGRIHHVALALRLIGGTPPVSYIQST